MLGNILCPETHLAPRIWDVRLWACGGYILPQVFLMIVFPGAVFILSWSSLEG